MFFWHNIGRNVFNANISFYITFSLQNSMSKFKEITLKHNMKIIIYNL